MESTSVRSRVRHQAAVALAAALAAASTGGCPVVGSLLNPELTSALGLSSRASELPGEAPAVVFEVDNQTGRPIEFTLSWRDADEQIQQRRRILPDGEKFAEAVVCPVSEVTLGDVSNPEAVGAIVRLGDGTPNDPFIEVEPFGVLLQDGINYDCGDVVTFAVRPSGATDSGFQIFAFIRRSGAQTFANANP